MIVTVPRRDLLAACALARKVGIALRIRVPAEGGALLLETSDIPRAVHLRQRVEAQIERPLSAGGIVVDSTDLHKIARAWAAYTFLRLEALDAQPDAPEPRGVLRVTAGKAHADIVLRDPDAPASPSDPPEHDDTLIGRVNLDALGEALRVAGRAAKDAARGALCSVLLEPRQKAGEPVLRAIATDGHCLAYAYAPWTPESGDAGRGWLLSPAAIAVLSAFSGSSGNVELRGDPAGAVLQCTTDSGSVLTLDSVRGDGTADNFVDYTGIVPSLAHTPARVTVRREPLLTAAKACAAFAEGQGCAKLELDSAGAGIRVRLDRDGTRDGAQEHLEDPIGVTLDDWPAGLRIGCNPSLLAALLEITRADEVTLHFADSLSPIVWRLDDSGGMAVLMPMRLE